MKKYLVTLCLLLALGQAQAQTCEQREEKLLETVGSFTASLLYNTYGMIGSIGDAFGANAYQKETVHNLMDAQLKLMDNLVGVQEKMIAGGFLTSKDDQAFTRSVIEILKGLKEQAQLLQDYVNKKNRQKLTDYENQRKKNWKDISQLMGIEE